MNTSHATRIVRSVIAAALLAAVAAAAGCASSAPAYERTFEPYVNPVHGKVVRVNTRDRYVVLECTVLPSAGEQITLYRNRKAVAQARVSSLRDGRFAVADLLDGAAVRGDWFIGSNEGFVPQPRR